MFTRQHYRAIEGIVKTVGSSYRGHYVYEWLAGMLADYFALDNPRFDRRKFLDACGVEFE